MREKLLSLIGKIGRDAKIPRTTSQVGIAIFRHKCIKGQFLFSLSDPYEIAES